VNFHELSLATLRESVPPYKIGIYRFDKLKDFFPPPVQSESILRVPHFYPKSKLQKRPLFVENYQTNYQSRNFLFTRHRVIPWENSKKNGKMEPRV
jgi:hypothetical protein